MHESLLTFFVLLGFSLPYGESLINTIGNQSVLVVEVNTANNGNGKSKEEISKIVFGNSEGKLDLTSVYKTRSHNKLSVIKVPNRTAISGIAAENIVHGTLARYSFLADPSITFRPPIDDPLLPSTNLT